MKFLKEIKDFCYRFFSLQKPEKEEESSSVEQTEFGYVIIAILLYLLLFLLLHEVVL